MNKENMNVEIKTALERKIPIYTYPEILSWLTKQFYTIGIAGTHGKSTSTAMIGWLFKELGLNPTVILGTTSLNWNSNALVPEVRIKKQTSSKSSKFQVPSSRILIIEADEYREAFLQYDLKGLVITSIEYDHPDYYKSFGKYINVFRKVAEKIPKDGFIIGCGDDSNVLKVLKYVRTKNVFTYGFKSNNDLVIKNDVIKGRCQTFMIKAPRFGIKNLPLVINFPLEPYALNAGAAVAGLFAFLKRETKSPMHKFSLPREKFMHSASKTFVTFKGTKRRFEIISRKPHSPIIIDDYAHHPTAVRTLLAAVKNAWPKKKILIVFEPHTFSRTAALKNEFAKCFDLADEVIIFKTYGSARESSGEFDSQDLVRLIQKRYSCSYAPDYESARKQISDKIKTAPGDWIVLTSGAGEIWRLANNFITKV